MADSVPTGASFPAHERVARVQCPPYVVDSVDAVCTISDADLASLASGKASAQKLYQQGKLRIDGDISVGHLADFFKELFVRRMDWRRLLIGHRPEVCMSLTQISRVFPESAESTCSPSPSLAVRDCLSSPKNTIFLWDTKYEDKEFVAQGEPGLTAC